jgi:hypothetical protein
MLTTTLGQNNLLILLTIKGYLHHKIIKLNYILRHGNNNSL